MSINIESTYQKCSIGRASFCNWPGSTTLSYATLSFMLLISSGVPYTFIAAKKKK